MRQWNRLLFYLKGSGNEITSFSIWRLKGCGRLFEISSFWKLFALFLVINILASSCVPVFQEGSLDLGGLVEG